MLSSILTTNVNVKKLYSIVKNTVVAIAIRALISVLWFNRIIFQKGLMAMVTLEQLSFISLAITHQIGEIKNETQF